MRQTVIELRDKDGVMPYSAQTLTDAVRGTREYLRHLLSTYPADMPLVDALERDEQLSLRSTAKAFEPLNWLLEDAVITDRIEEKGGEA